MKVNEALEKIYVLIDPVWGSMSVNYNRNDINNIEYVRPDVFIEKACSWLKNNASDYAFVDTDRIGNVADIDLSLISDFKNYMKGE